MSLPHFDSVTPKKQQILNIKHRKPNSTQNINNPHLTLHELCTTIQASLSRLLIKNISPFKTSENVSIHTSKTWMSQCEHTD